MLKPIFLVLGSFCVYAMGAMGYAGIALLMGIESACIPLPSELIMPYAGAMGVPEANAYLLGLRPRGVTGSTWALNPHGDYDFSLAVLTTLLWRCGDNPDVLYPASRQHLLTVLLTEGGGEFRATAPRTLGFVRKQRRSQDQQRRQPTQHDTRHARLS